MRRRALLWMVAACSAAAQAAPAPADPFEGDPFQSHQWPELKKEFLGAKARVVFDDRVKVQGPPFAEDPMNVPVTVNAALPGVQRIVVLVDRNPIRKVLELQPLSAQPTVGFRFKLEQASPVRAAAQTADGVWHVGGALVDSAGGGCTVPGASRADGSWSRTLNQVQARVFRNVLDGGTRLRLRIMHPMDTGLVGGIPAFHIEQLELRDAQDRPSWRLHLHEPVSENPLLTLELGDGAQGPWQLVGRDNNGNRIDERFKA